MRLLIGLLIFSTSTVAANWQLRMDNDILLRDDGDYSNGLSLRRASHSSLHAQPSAIRSQGQLLPGSEQRIQQWALEHKMWTPNEIAISTPQPDDRPYAATLSIRSMLSSQHNNNHYTNWIEAGILGPSAQGERAQRHVHMWTDSSEPLGWSHQVQDTLLLNVGMEGDFPLWRQPNHLLSVQAAAEWGTTSQYLQVGTSAMWGKGIEPGILSSVYGLEPRFRYATNRYFLYAALRQRYVLEDKTVTGSVNYASRVDLTPHQTLLLSGLYIQYQQWATDISMRYGHSTFRPSSDKYNGYASLALLWFY
ncbi:lipid A-modifier LpxR family protein [Thaumasiovibrio sp. DFM-14]|uniref:lipid A-modifier LpxR family protein n=1 Tax=Thaumasiovibrio sp. DFM-14 TaxID=3384792 RepID=UPI00399F0908